MRRPMQRPSQVAGWGFFFFFSSYYDYCLMECEGFGKLEKILVVRKLVRKHKDLIFTGDESFK